MTTEVHIGAWSHGPLHVFAPNTHYIVTASTLQRQRVFTTPRRLSLMQDALFEAMQAYAWELEAWALFSTHYHFVAHSPQEGASLKRLIQRLHSQSARRLNEIDGTPGRRVWFQYWDTCLTHEASYYARLNYVHHNAVKHGLVTTAELYEFCSAGWFREHADADFYQRVISSAYDRVNVPDGFEEC